jgi:peptidoglycan LD-endopeptidase CwlK
MRGLELLRPKVRKMAENLLIEAKSQKLDLIIADTLRTKPEQNKLYQQGRIKAGKRVTNARGGYSLHNYGVAFDFCPVKSGKLAWDKDLACKIGRIGEGIGLEWGGSWKVFKDPLHFQYRAGYTIKDFINKKVDWKKFEL